MLTDAHCKTAVCLDGKPRSRYSDSGGLYLEVAATGSRRWFWKYRFTGKEKRLALGAYPAVSLKAARLARDEARLVLVKGDDPAQKRKVEKVARQASAAVTYEAVARELHKLRAKGWSEAHAYQWIRCQEKDLFPWLGALPLPEISPAMLLTTLRRVEDRGTVQMAHDLREFAGQVFRYGMVTSRCTTNPARELTGALRPHTVRNMPAITSPSGAGRLMRSISAYDGQPATRAALKLSALIFQRPGNVRALEWAWLDLAGGMLTIPPATMKRSQAAKLNGRPHFVPLARQAVALLRDVRPLTGHGRYVFPSVRTDDRPMSENTVNAALRGLGYTKDEMTAHGFRAMARTLMVEHLPGIAGDVIEAQLGHGKSGPLGEAYDRAEYMAQRREMMQRWADYLDELSQAG